MPTTGHPRRDPSGTCESGLSGSGLWNRDNTSGGAGRSNKQIEAGHHRDETQYDPHPPVTRSGPDQLRGEENPKKWQADPRNYRHEVHHGGSGSNGWIIAPQRMGGLHPFPGRTLPFLCYHQLRSNQRAHADGQACRNCGATDTHVYFNELEFFGRFVVSIPPK